MTTLIIIGFIIGVATGLISVSITSKGREFFLDLWETLKNKFK